MFIKTYCYGENLSHWLEEIIYIQIFDKRFAFIYVCRMYKKFLQISKTNNSINYRENSHFIKEGILNDYVHKKVIIINNHSIKY